MRWDGMGGGEAGGEGGEVDEIPTDYAKRGVSQVG